MDSTWKNILEGTAVGVMLSVSIIHFFILSPEDVKNAKLKQEKKLKEIKEFIKIHDKSN